MQTIKINNWEEFQHYAKRNPPWIKLHTQLLDNDSLECLQDDSKWLLVCLWLYNARKGNGKIRADPKALAKKLPISKRPNLQLLANAGFIELVEDDSTPQAPCKQDATYIAHVEERRGRGEERQRREENVYQIFHHWNSKKEKKWRGSRKLNGNIPPDVADVIRPHLKTYSVDTIKAAIDNYAWSLLSRDSFWTRAWNIVEFFTIHDKDKNLQWVKRFLPHNFQRDDYYTPESRRRIIEEKRQAKQVLEKIVPSAKSLTPEEKRARRSKLPQQMQDRLRIREKPRNKEMV